MSTNAQIALVALFAALVFAAGFGVALWFDRTVDAATRLPHRPHGRGLR